ncbi:MAG: hypothetical protein ACXACY_31515 [Candidatus Hodarchaeales archaeon]
MIVNLGINGLLVLFAVYFGLRAVIMFKRTNIGEVVADLNAKEKHKLRLLYSTVFLGSTIVSLSFIQAVNLSVIQIHSFELALSAVNLAFLFSAYTWYSFLKELHQGKEVEKKPFSNRQLTNA